MITIPGLGLFFRIYTRDELMEEVFWILRLVSSLSACGAAMQVLVESGLTTPAIVYLAISVVMLASTFVRIYWVRFGAMLLWVAIFVADFFLRRNPCGVPFIAIGAFYLYKMLKYCGMYEGRTVMK